MTLTEITTLIEDFVKVNGQPYTTTELPLINECISVYAEETLTFFDPKITFATANNTSEYDLRSATFSLRVCLPVNVAINNTVLLDFYGRPGPITNREWHGLSDAYTAAATASVTRWSFEPPNHIRIYPQSNGAISNSYVSGFYLPADLASGSDEVPLPIEQERELVAFIVARLLDPRASGDSLEKMTRLDAYAAENFAKRKARAAEMMRTVYRSDQVKA